MAAPRFRVNILIAHRQARASEYLDASRLIFRDVNVYRMMLMMPLA